MTFSHPITKIKLDPEGKTAAVVRGSHLYFFDVATGTQTGPVAQGHQSLIRSVEFDESGRFVITSGDDKLIVVWSRSIAGNEWKVATTVTTPKKMTGAQFTPNMQSVVLADKIGDVYHFPLSVSAEYNITAPSAPEVIVGHYSSISSMTLSSDGKFVITGDKDEHVRVSNYPYGFDIQSFCLGHTEFISGLLVSKKFPRVLVSGSGDGTLKLWDLTTGDILDSIFIGDNKDKKSEDADSVIPLDIHEATQNMIVSVEEKAEAYIVTLSENKLTLKSTITLNGPIGSASFDAAGNIWASYLPINKLKEQMALDAAATSTSSTTTTTPSSSSSSSTNENASKLVYLESGKYTAKEDSPLIVAVNKVFTDSVEKQAYFSGLHDLSKSFQFRKRFGDGNFSMGNNYYQNAGDFKSKKGKRSKVEKSEEKLEKNDPIVPNFVE